jgi:hypothetical protein
MVCTHCEKKQPPSAAGGDVTHQIRQSSTLVRGEPAPRPTSRYRVDAVDGNDNDYNDITPPLASPASDGEECEEEAEATQDGGGVF